jgi:hypothetical protein
MSDLDPRISDTMSEAQKPLPIPEVAPEPEPSSRILLWAIGIVVVLVLAIVAIRIFYVGTTHGETVEYNGFVFEKQAGLWQTQWQQGNVQLLLGFHFTPQQTLNITPSIASSWNHALFDQQQVIIAFDPTKEDQTYVQVAATELTFKMHALGYNVTPGYTNNATGDFPSRPIANCNTKNTSVIIVQDINVTPSVIAQNTCITVLGYESELVRAVDRLQYTFYGILPALGQ